MAVRHTITKVLKGMDYQANLLLDEYNNRIKIKDYMGRPDQVIRAIKDLSDQMNMGKVIYFAKDKDKNAFEERGFIEEGKIEGFYNGQNACCLSFFSDEKRRYSDHPDEEDKILETALNVKTKENREAAKDYIIREAGQGDAEEIAKLFESVFITYPTPMHQPQYIEGVMESKILFMVAENKRGEMISAGSAEINREYFNAEITDCATKQAYRGKGVLSSIILSLEVALAHQGIKTLYSLSRAMSYGMNIILSRNNYQYAGRMIKNCNIMGDFEDLNLWVKSI